MAFIIAIIWYVMSLFTIQENTTSEIDSIIDSDNISNKVDNQKTEMINVKSDKNQIKLNPEVWEEEPEPMID